VKIAHIDVHVFRAPTPVPVATSFGTMRDRPAVFVRLTATDGAFGWGEIFANWPAAGAEHRARLLCDDMADLILGQDTTSPEALFADLTTRTRIRALQCGEPGPFAQVIAGLDTAMHDLCARRTGQVLARNLNPDARLCVPVYASGIAISDAPVRIPAARSEGLSAFKVKIGFDQDRDGAMLDALMSDLADGERFFADANQAWTLDQALDFVGQAPILGWLEEPIAADSPPAHWAELAAATRSPLAGGENIAGSAAFAASISDGYLQILQPDVAKWGGITGCLSVAHDSLAAGRTYCPHFLGGGIGLAASAHLLAAAGGPGLLELDVNENPLRDAFFEHNMMTDGRFKLSDGVGLGIDHLPRSIEGYRTLHLEARAA
jgi:L-alanine-DL-glutamate epimerase-like enolase superfamily enzyme